MTKEQLIVYVPTPLNESTKRFVMCTKCAPIGRYLALYPAGHFGLAPLMVFTALPLKHLSVLTAALIATGVGDADADGATSFGFSCVATGVGEADGDGATSFGFS